MSCQQNKRPTVPKENPNDFGHMLPEYDNTLVIYVLEHTFQKMVQFCYEFSDPSYPQNFFYLFPKYFPFKKKMVTIGENVKKWS